MQIFTAISDFFARSKERVGDQMDDWNADVSEGSLWVKILLGFLIIGLLGSAVLGFIWNGEPSSFSVRDKVADQGDTSGRPVTGLATSLTLIQVTETLLDKPGGFISNDMTLPGAWMDNIPNWEYGVLIQVRDISKAMREAFSRSQSQSTEDNDLALAESRFNFDHDSWVMPTSESEYREGIKFLKSYRNRLVDSDQHDAQFFARADNLRYWLRTVETRLGSLSQRLSASVGQRRLNTDLAGDSSATQSTRTPAEVIIKTPWTEIDDVFYEARGSSWALLHFLKAIEVDFADVLAKKNALVSLRQIIRELEATQEDVFPVILNGGGFGMLANHSLVMASYISRANAAIIDLRELLAQG